jgi:transposase
MNSRVKIACGLDVHRSKIVGSIVTSAGTNEMRTFTTNIDDTLALKDWILTHECERVAMEATGIYWYPIYNLLEEHVTVQVANPLFIKGIPGRKTDQLDAEWIATLCLNGLVKPSYVPGLQVRNRRDLVRTLNRLIQIRTRHKNRIHKVMVRAGIRIAAHLSDLFGPSGLRILNGLLEGQSIDTILKNLKNAKIAKKREELAKSICGSLDENDVYLIRLELDAIGSVNRLIDDLKQRISYLMIPENEDLNTLMSIPGIGYDSAVNLLAEIGDIRQFPSGKHLVSWAGLAPGMNESAGKHGPAHITKRGSKFLRTFLIEPAHSIAGMKRNNHLKRFFSRMRGKLGYKPAIIALARKLLMLVHHLLVKRELYFEENLPKKKPVKITSSSLISMTPDQILKILSDAVTELSESDRAEFVRKLNHIGNS